MSRLRRLALGLMVAGLVLGTAEAVARLALGPPPQTFFHARKDVGLGQGARAALFPDHQLDPLAPTPNQRPADAPWFHYEATGADGRAVWRRNGDRLMHRPQDSDRIPVPAQAGVTRVFCLGGSTVFGIPGAEEGAFSDYLQADLDLESRGSFEVINLGNPALDSFDLLELAQATAVMDPDLYIVYTGHNDAGNAWFFSRYLLTGSPRLLQLRVLLYNHLRLYSLLRDVVVPLRDQVGAPPDLAATAAGSPQGADAQAQATATRRQVRDNQRVAVTTAFRANLLGIVDAAQAVGAQVILVQPASDLSHAPGDSAHFQQLDPAQASRFDQALAQGRSAGPDQLAALQQATALDPTFAEASWRQGMALLAAGDQAAAHQALWTAVRWDVVSLRAWPEVLGAMSRVGQETGVAVLSAEEILADDRGIPDPSLFADNVHLTTRGHRRLADALLPQVRAAADGAGQVAHDQAGR